MTGDIHFGVRTIGPTVQMDGTIFNDRRHHDLRSDLPALYS